MLWDHVHSRFHHVNAPWDKPICILYSLRKLHENCYTMLTADRLKFQPTSFKRKGPKIIQYLIYKHHKRMGQWNKIKDSDKQECYFNNEMLVEDSYLDSWLTDILCRWKSVYKIVFVHVIACQNVFYITCSSKSKVLNELSDPLINAIFTIRSLISKRDKRYFISNIALVNPINYNSSSRRYYLIAFRVLSTVMLRINCSLSSSSSYN